MTFPEHRHTTCECGAQGKFLADGTPLMCLPDCARFSESKEEVCRCGRPIIGGVCGIGCQTWNREPKLSVEPDYEAMREQRGKAMAQTIKNEERLRERLPELPSLQPTLGAQPVLGDFLEAAHRGTPLTLDMYYAIVKLAMQAERDSITAFGERWIDGYTAGHREVVAKAIDTFMADVIEEYHYDQ